MERQIKFRGKHLDNGKWVVGDLFHIAGGCLIYFGSDTDTAEPDIEKSNPIAVEFFKDEIAVVDPDSVGQFTGLCDKNGKEIYEGDIVRYIDCNDTISVNEVRYSDAGFTPVCEIAWMADIEGTECEVIGNRFGNSELISDKQ